MPRSFDMSADYEGSVEEVHRAFYEADYWKARLAETPVDVATLESIRVGGDSGDDGTIEVVTLQMVRSHNLPGLVTQLHRGDLSVRREETWGPVKEGIATASIAGSIVDAPVNLWGTAVLSPIPESGGSRMTLQVTIQVRIPFIGGKLERLIGTQLSQLVTIEQRFTTLWITQIRSGTDPAANLQLVGKYAGEAATAGAQLVVFPEATMCRLGVPLRQVAEPVDGPWANGVRRIATEAGITVIAGMFTPTGDGRVTNTLIAAGPGTPNQPDAHYHKIHLYDAFGFTESRTVAPGREPVVVVVDGVRVGLTVCYDIRFPALYTELARRGAQLIAVCASWGSGPGKLEQWTLLARARALDSMSYVAAAGQADPGDARTGVGASSAAPTGVGGSLVASPLGEVVVSAGTQPQLLVADIDVDNVAAARDRIAVLRNQTDFVQIDKAQSRG